MRTLFLVGFLCQLVCDVFSQAHHYSLRNYSAVDGLPQSQVNSMLEDKNGYLWVATQSGGLARFDGAEFKVYTTLDGLLGNDIWGIVKDGKENLWMLHARGVTRYDGQHFKRFLFPSGSDDRFDKIYNQYDTIFLFSRSSGTISKIYNDSLYYSNKPIKRNLVNMKLHLGPAGEACFFAKDQVVIHARGARFSIQFDKQFSRGFSVFNWRDKVLIRGEFGFYRLDIAQKSIQEFLPDFIVKNQVLFHDGKRNVFWTKNANGLFKETFKNGILTIDTVISDVDFSQILVDSEENTWLASDGHGLYKYFIQDFEQVNNDKSQCVMCITKGAHNCIWMGTMNKGLGRVDNGQTIFYADPQSMYRNSIHAIKTSPQGRIWAGSEHGLGCYDPVKDNFKWMTIDDGLPGNKVMGIDFDADNGMWIGTFNGVGYYKNERWVKYYRTGHGLKSNAIWSLFYKKNTNTLFVGSNLGLQKIIDDKISSVVVKGLENAAVLSISPFKESFIIAGTAGGGLLFINTNTEQCWQITTHDGLASDFIYFVTVDEKGYVWVGTEKGINRIKLNKGFKVVENFHYGYDNGLTGLETNHNAFYFDATGKYFGLVDGLYKFNEMDYHRNSPFQLHLTDIQLLYGEYSSRDYADSVFGFFKIPYKLSLPPDRNHVTFYFNRVDKRYPKSVKFKYFLENFDKTWSLPCLSKQVTYGNLPPGDYIFRVKATNNQGIWCDVQIAYAFTVQAPFYMRSTFVVGAIILIIGLVTLVLYIRVRQRIQKVVILERIRAKEQETLRKDIARDFHDEMGNQLTRIINYVSQLKLNGHDVANQHELYAKVEQSAKYLYTGTRDFIWSIDPVNDELLKLFIHIRDFGEKLFSEKNINFRAFNNVKEKFKLPYGFSREANLIFKEAMTNAFKYSEAKNVSFSLLQGDDSFEMILEDDGKGFYFATIEKSSGLINIRERADKINSILRIRSEVGKGTAITLNFKINKPVRYGFTI